MYHPGWYIIKYGSAASQPKTKHSGVLHMIRMDLHMHSTCSDGTDKPEDLPGLIRHEGITLFSLTDHDSTDGCKHVKNELKLGETDFLTGVEFSCKDELGKYHILGYGYDPGAASIKEIVALGHRYRMDKLDMRLQRLKEMFGIAFAQEDVDLLHTLNNPGKPHIANLMVRCGFAENRVQAITQYLNKLHCPDLYVSPQQAIRAVADGGGIPVLAHPCYGSGDQQIMGAELDERVKYLMDFGLKGLEGFYSAFVPKQTKQVLDLAEKYKLYITAGSDYHGSNKLISLGDTGLEQTQTVPKGLDSFLERIADLPGFN